MKNIKNILTCSFLILYNLCHSQNIENLNSTDTIYIYFDHSKYQEVKDSQIINTLGEIKLDDKNFICFSERKYLNFDSVDNNIKMEKRTEKKKFLKKNKSVIFNTSSIINYGFKDFYYKIGKK